MTAPFPPGRRDSPSSGSGPDRNRGPLPPGLPPLSLIPLPCPGRRPFDRTFVWLVRIAPPSHSHRRATRKFVLRSDIQHNASRFLDQRVIDPGSCRGASSGSNCRISSYPARPSSPPHLRASSSAPPHRLDRCGEIAGGFYFSLRTCRNPGQLRRSYHVHKRRVLERLMIRQPESCSRISRLRFFPHSSPRPGIAR